MPRRDANTPEHVRLAEDARREKNWTRWGPYLAERQWGTVREDYSADGESWSYFTHEHARSRAYRWGEDGLLGITDRECRLCFALALWNGRDPFLKERLFGLTGPEGNHGEDVKECYFHLDATPTASWLRALYKYPQAEFPYERLRAENRRRGRGEPEFELLDTGVFEAGKYFDVLAEYAKGGPNDVLVQITVANRGPEAATLHVLPMLWFRNTWSWGCRHEGCEVKPTLRAVGEGGVQCEHPSLGRFFWAVEPAAEAVRLSQAGETLTRSATAFLFTENETNAARLWAGAANASAFTKDAFHECVVGGRREAVNPAGVGTKCASHHVLALAAGEERVLRLRLYAEDERPGGSTASGPAEIFGAGFGATLAARRAEADAFYAALLGGGNRFETQSPFAVAARAELRDGIDCDEARRVARQAYAGLIWSKQFYHLVVRDWLDGDPGQPPAPARRKTGRNSDWPHVFARDVLSMPDKWEYPWFAAWDLAFHMVPMARVDPAFAKAQLNLLLREWYMHPNGQIPAYEWNFSDVNPPVHAWACWRVYKMTGPRGGRDRVWLARVFQKLLLNFTWWVNRKDPGGRHLFSGGFLGLDNIGVFDRSKPLPTGGTLEQADGTAWMAFYCGTMLSMALELAGGDPAYEDIASKFFEHFVAIADAMNTLGGSGLWHDEDGFYYDQLLLNGRSEPLRLRSMVGIIPLFAVELIDETRMAMLPGFAKRTRWFLENRPDLAATISHLEKRTGGGRLLLAIPTGERLARVLRYVLDEAEFLSPHGVRSLSRAYRDRPFSLRVDGNEWRVGYVPGESDSGLFGGNSNWRGPVWMPMNYLLIESLERYHQFYGDSFSMEFPTGSGRMMTLAQIARELARRLVTLFLPDGGGRRPALGMEPRFASDPNWRELVWFHEYFHGETGHGLGASHQTGWTALVARLIEEFSE
ncbi:MAG: glucosidase [Verrucomicrobia bacterium]|nr:glucosidase [Verrucomicrobiota bacterium]